MSTRKKTESAPFDFPFNWEFISGENEEDMSSASTIWHSGRALDKKTGDEFEYTGYVRSKENGVIWGDFKRCL